MLLLWDCFLIPSSRGEELKEFLPQAEDLEIGISIRVYFFEQDGSITKIPRARFDRLCDEDSGCVREISMGCIVQIKPEAVKANGDNRK